MANRDDEITLQIVIFEDPTDSEVKVFLPEEETPEEEKYKPQQGVLLDDEMMEVISSIPEDKKEAFRSLLNLVTTAAYQGALLKEE